MEVLVERIVAGVPVVTFEPTPQMRLFVMTALCDKSFQGKTPEEICVGIGIGKKSYEKFQSFDPWFSEWVEDQRIKVGGKNKRAALEFVGMQMALAGEFNFWKPLALREGVISPDRLEIGVNIPSSLPALRELNVDQLTTLENSILAELRAEADSGTITLAEGPDGWQREGDPGRADEVQGSVVLHPKLGTDGERALDGLDSF